MKPGTKQFLLTIVCNALTVMATKSIWGVAACTMILVTAGIYTDAKIKK